MKDLNLDNLGEQATAAGAKLIEYVSRYRTILTLLVACVAILASVMQAQSFLNPERNEDTFAETKSQVNVKSIDQDVLQKLEKTQADRTNSASSNFVPGRNDPFAE